MKAAVRLLLILALVAPTFASAQTAAAPAPTCRLFASATIVAPNTKVRLDWTTTNATSGYLPEVGALPPNGYVFVVPGKNTTYAASFTGPGGTIICRVGVGVSAGAPVGGGVTVPAGQPVNVPTATLPAAPSTGITAPSGSGFVGGIVPQECRGRSTIANCDLCSLAQLAQNIANFLLGLTVPAAALLFAWAGILYFSSRGDPVRIGQAHKIFKSVVIGFVLAVSAWVLVITVMNMLVHGGELGTWDWRSLKCQQTREARKYNMSLSEYLSSSLPGLSSGIVMTPVGGSGGSGGSGGDTLGGGGGSGASGCAVGGTLTAENFCVRDDGFVYEPGSNYTSSSGVGGVYTLSAQQEDLYTYQCSQGNTDSCNVLDLVGQPTSGSAGVCGAGSVYSEGSCYNPITDAITDPFTGSSGGTIRNPRMAAEIEVACAQISTVNCDYARAIALRESGGGNNCTTSNTGAAGCMQVLARTACSMDSSISDSCGACLASGNSIRPQCAPVIDTIKNDTQLGTTLGVRYIDQMQRMPALQALRNQYGECQITAAAYFQGPGRVLEVGGVPSNAVSYVNKTCGS